MREWMYRSTLLDLGTSWSWVVSFTALPLYPGGKETSTHWIGGWVGPRAGLDDVKKKKFLTLPGLELRPLDRPARSQSLYRLRYLDSLTCLWKLWHNDLHDLQRHTYGSCDLTIWNTVKLGPNGLHDREGHTYASSNFMICRIVKDWSAEHFD
jgi:hypothetical protein